MEPMIGEIRMFGGNFAPRGWALCDGQLIAISQNNALFSILGTTYGGDGRTSFGLPDMRGRSALSSGTGPGLTPRPLGQKTGTETNTLNVNHLASHNHVTTNAGTAGIKVPVSTNDGTESSPEGNYPATAGEDIYNDTPSPGAFMAPISLAGMAATVPAVGNNTPINNMMPFQTVNYIIALVGTYPSRS